MNAQKQLEAKDVTIRNLTIERDALKAKSDVQRKALAHEAMETVKLRAELDALKQAAKPVAKLINWFPASVTDETQTMFDSPDGHIITVGELRRHAELLK